MRGTATVDDEDAPDARLVDNPYRRESHRPWYARRALRWIVALCVVGLFVVNAFAFKKVGTRADPISVDTAVARYRATSTTTRATTSPVATNGDAASAAVQPSSPDAAEPTATTIAGTAGEVGAERGPAPTPGVYVYDTSGFETVDVLGGARHDYPATSTMTVTTTDCGVDVKWAPIEQRFDEWDMCIRGTGLTLRTYTTHHEFFGQAEQHRFLCTGVDVRPPTDTPGLVTTGSCEDQNGPNHATTRTTVVGPDTVTVQAVDVPAIKLHLEQYLTGDIVGSEISDLWLRPADGLLMKWSSVVHGDGKTVLGHTKFYEEDNVSLTNLTPLQ